MKTKKKFLSLMLVLIMLLSTIFPTNWVDVYAAPTDVVAKCRICGSAMRFVNSTEPTCSALGNYAYWTCSNYDCEEANEVVFLDENCSVEGTFDEAMIDTIDHELIERTIPKCGGKETFTYYVCKYPDCLLENAFSENDFQSEMTAKELQSAVGHNLISVSEKIPTCQDDGVIPHLQCATCKKRFAEIVNYIEVTSEEMTMPKVDHIWSDNYFSDETHHWFLCLIKGCKNEVANHTYDQEIVNEEWLAADANCAHGTLYYKSCVCGKVGTETFEVGEPLENHNLTTIWVYDDHHHWYECKAEDCEYKESVTEHKFDLIVMKDEHLASEPDCQNKARYFMSCECGATGTETVEDQNGEFGNHTPDNKWSYDETTHYHACMVDDCDGKVDVEEHDWIDKNVITYPTTEEPGLKKVECSICLYETEQEMPVLGRQHHWDDNYSFNDTHHWYDCVDEGCEEQNYKAEHEFVEKVAEERYLDKSATCASKATYFKSCICGAKGTETFESGVILDHVLKTGYVFDDAEHWNTCENCTEKIHLMPHDWEYDEVISESTCTVAGKQERHCLICGFEDTINLELADHDFGEEFLYDKNEHYKQCKCGEKTEIASHDDGEWEIIVEGNCETDTKLERTCHCGYVEEKIIDAEGHLYEGQDFMYDEENHWRICVNCETAEIEMPHVFGDWRVTDEATCQEVGKKERICDCGYTEEEEISTKSHSHVIPNYDNLVHWMECECGDVAEVSEHNLNDWIIITHPTCAKDGLSIKTCSGCQYTEEMYTEKENHDFSGEWKNNDDQHWYECECGETTERENHVMGDWIVIVEPKCNSVGTKQQKCVDCGFTIEKEIPTIDCVFTEDWHCDVDGHWKECDCGKTTTKEEHEFELLEIVKLPTCFEKGVRLDKCSVCEYEEQHDIDTIDHEWEDKLTFNQTGHWQSCTTDGCQEKLEFVEHTFDQEIMTNETLATAATCVKKATYFKSCVCGAKGTETFEHGELSTEHDIEDKLYCDETNHFKKCSVEGCNYVSESKQHIFDKEVATEEFEASKATCQSKAKYYKSCVCGKAGTEKFESGEVAKHVMGTTYEKDATGHWTKCTTEGCTEKSKVEEHTFKDGESKCSVCGQEKEHVCTLKEVSAKSATCEKAGNIAHYKCKECSKLYEDKDGKKEITEEKVIIAKTEHKNTWYITKEATKDKVGELKGKCSVCGTSTKMDLEKLGISGKLTFDVDDDAKLEAELNTDDIYKLVELTTDEVKEINNGMGLNILLSIEDLDEDITSSDKKKMEEKMDDDYKLIKYLDITLTKQLLDDDKVKESDELDETSEELEIVLEIPEKMQGKDTYKVLRLHNGKVEILDAEYDKDDKTITFETDQFSTYAVVYEDKDAAKEDSKADSTTGTVMPDAGDNNIIFLWATMAMISAFGLSVMLQKKKED